MDRKEYDEAIATFSNKIRKLKDIVKPVLLASIKNSGVFSTTSVSGQYYRNVILAVDEIFDDWELKNGLNYVMSEGIDCRTYTFIIPN
jgi:hypothetical protein